MDCLDNRHPAERRGFLFNELLKITAVINPKFKFANTLNSIMALKIGNSAPDFRLFDSEMQTYSLSQFQGKKNVLLLFFPLAFTSTCTKELCGVRDDIGQYSNDTTQVFGISVDSVFSLAKFKDEQRFNYPLLSDFNKTASISYEALYESFGKFQMQGVSKRSAFIIDRAGNIQYAEVLENAGEVPNFDAIDKKLTELA